MTGGLSLRARVLAGMLFVVGALVIVAFSVTSLTHRHLINQIDQQLTSSNTSSAGPGGPARGRGDFDDRLSTFYEATVDVSTGDVSVRARPTAGDDIADPKLTAHNAAAAARLGEPITIRADDGAQSNWRVIAHYTGAGDEIAVVALPLHDVKETIGRLILIEVVASVAMIAVLAAVAWWVIRLGIRPLKQMTETAATIAAGDLTQRVPELPPSTEAGRLGAALNHMLAQLEAAFDARATSQQRLQQFVADASHELRTPVTTIRGYAELYRLGGLHGNGALAEAMDRTEAEAVRMARLVDDMLTIAKLGEGRPLERLCVDLAQLVADAAADAKAVAPDREITTTTGPGQILVAGDEDRLRQVIANITANAITHTPAGTPIELGARQARAHDGAEGVAIVTVTDHGNGMTAEVAAKVTERFYRADPSRSRDRGGSGLGMAIADAAVTAHGGTLDVTSELGVGTTVSVTLPVSNADDARGVVDA